jgi:uncharacterized protein YdeI (YjbR/CyaY-like superfamily)
MNIFNPKVDEFLNNAIKWQAELKKLRSIALDCLLVEDFKWKQPCYTHQNKNIVLIHGFKEYCALLFMKGSLLQDAAGILIQQTENVQSGRQIRFNNLAEITQLEPILKAYIFEATEVEKTGLKVESKTNTELVFPQEFEEMMSKDDLFKQAFFALTLGRQRGYHLFFTGAKQSKTIVARIENSRQHILDGFGLNDCTCGMSKRMPACDGSHKYI